MSEFGNFDRAATYYDQTRGFPPGVDVEAAAFIADKADLKPDYRLLEIGIGTGRIAVPLSKHVRCITGVDISRSMMTRLREKSPANPIYLAESDATYLPFVDNCFDACIAVHVFHLIPDVDACLSEVERVLKPQAALLLCGGPVADEFEDIDAIARKYAPPPIGIRQVEDIRTTIRTHGWQGRDEPYKFDGFRVKRNPHKLVDGFRNRRRSDTWRMSDDEHSAMLAEMDAVLQQNYPEPIDIEFDAAFYVEVYRRV
jgi:SAM-dependent methyltransferase